MSRKPSFVSDIEKAKLSRRNTLTAIGTGLLTGIAALSGDATISAQAQEAGEDGTEETSLAFVQGSEPAPGRTLQFSLEVEVENPPAEAEDISMRDAVSDKEIWSIAPNTEVEGTVRLNSTGSMYMVREDDRQAAKEEIEANIKESPSVELSEELIAEEDVENLGSIFVLSRSGDSKVTYAEDENVELVLLDGDRNQIKGTSEVITIEEAPEPTLVESKPAAGFNYPYFLYNPNKKTDGEAIPLLVEPNNTGTSTDDFQQHKSRAEKRVKNSTSRTLADELGVPLLVPVFPRPRSEPVDWTHYTHQLDRQTLALNRTDLERIDLQLLAMVDHAKENLDVNVRDKIMLNGFSASGNFSDRFTVLHPERVLSVTAGGLNGMALLPTDEMNGRRLPYHIGIADVDELIGKSPDLDALDNVNQLLYMGAEDDNDTLPYDDAWTKEEMRQLALEVYGEDMITQRFPTCQEAYQQAGIEAQFKIYADAGHTPRPAFDDIKEVHRRSMDGEDISDIGDALGFQPEISVEPKNPEPGQSVTFDASNSSLAGAEIVAITWRFGDEATAAGTTVTHTLGDSEPFRFQVKAIDSNGGEHTREFDISEGEIIPSTAEGEDSDESEETPTTEGGDSDESEETPTTTQGDDSATDTSTPGFGIAGTVAALGGAAYLIKDRVGDSTE